MEFLVPRLRWLRIRVPRLTGMDHCGSQGCEKEAISACFDERLCSFQNPHQAPQWKNVAVLTRPCIAGHERPVGKSDRLRCHSLLRSIQGGRAAMQTVLADRHRLV